MCQICKKAYKVKSGNTSTIKRHAQKVHPNTLKDLEKGSNPKFKQASIAGMLSTSKYSSDCSRRRELNKKLLKMIVKDLQPESIVEDEGFRDFVSALDKKYVLPTRATIRNTLLPAAFKEVMDEVMEEISEVEHLALTTDMWTSSTTDAYNTVTAHFWSTAVKKLKSKVLQCTRFEGRHTAEALAKDITNVQDQFKISKEKISATVSDNAHNIKKALKDLGVSSLPCFAHTLNLTVIEGIKAVPEVVKIRDKVAKVVTTTHKSPVAKEALQKCQLTVGIEAKSLKVLIQDVPTRWNSLFLMLERFELLKDSLTLFFAQGHVDDGFTVRDWENISGLIKILRPLYDATVEVSGEKHVTCSKVIPITNLLLKYYDAPAPGEASEVVKKFKGEILKSLKKRFGWVEDGLVYACSSLLDPRFKQHAFSSALKINQASQWVKKEANDKASRDDNTGQTDHHEPPSKKVIVH